MFLAMSLPRSAETAVFICGFLLLSLAKVHLHSRVVKFCIRLLVKVLHLSPVFSLRWSGGLTAHAHGWCPLAVSDSAGVVFHA